MELFMNEKTHTMTIAGLERHLPICRVSDSLSIAAFVIFGDVELTIAASSELLKKAPEFDVMITAEAKGIPLVYEMARQSGKPYFIARKYPKLYMANPISVDVRSITTDKEQTLYLDESEMAVINGKRVLIVDDVISTGESLRALDMLVERSGGKIAGQCAILAEGDAIDRKDIFYLEPLPLFFE
ncbi:MAG: phosphoribosyltransferase family protein [Oscillospiraceae bacterium]|nr:phosphoribosyltransferase family protein [Oscillospiraceae bacterium]MDD3832317.1 phosphoribosyltransferase family protein [Oscillospiraceae bacterium]MDD4545734.1 phosphoribosyltransferase family protein [Oscillospiraceae bacterium]